MSNPETTPSLESQESIKNPYADFLANPEAKNDVPYTPEQLVRIVFESFRVGQAEPKLQAAFFNFFVKQHKDRITTDLEDLKIMLVDKISAWMGNKNHRAITDEQITENVNAALADLQKSLDGENPIEEDLDPDTIIRRDLKYISSANPAMNRPRQGNPNVPQKSHPHNHSTSFFAHNILAGKTTGVDEIDEYYQACLKKMTNELATNDEATAWRKTYVTLLLQTHYRSHPDSISDVTPQANHYLAQLIGEGWRETVSPKSSTSDRPR